MSKIKKNRCWKSALELTVVYLVICVLYITFSSKFAAMVARDVDHLQQIEIWKGNLFIVVTGFLLFFYSHFMLKRDHLRQYELHMHRMALLASEQRSVFSQMAWAIGTDINHILTIISFNIELLEKKSSDGEGAKRIIEALGSSTKRLHFLAKKLRNAGRSVFTQDVQSLKVQAVIDDAVELAQMVRSDMISAVQVDCPADTVLKGYESIFQQAIFNVVLNAMDAADMGPCIIEINVKSMDGTVMVAIHDNGPGIPEEQESKIFDTFYTTKEKGAGLGLLSAQLCAQIHQGDLTICESHLGGACFCMELPAEESGSAVEYNYAI